MVRLGLRARLAEVSWRDLLATLLLFALLLGGLAWAAVRLVRPAAPRAITLSTGPEGSAFQRAAERYAKAFAAHGVTLRLRPSNGSLENLQRLADPGSDVELGFVQVGVKLPEAKPDDPGRRELVSLGTIFRQPLYVLTRGKAPPDRLSALAGKRIVVGPEGSGTRVLAARLLKANGIEPGGATSFLDLDDEEVGPALQQGRIDAAFLMSDSASPRVIRALLQLPEVQVLRLAQLDAYLRRFQDLDRVVIPMGAFDLAKNLPPADLDLVGATVEMVSHANLHPAISDLLIETMRQVHARPTLLQRSGEFPAAREHELPLSDDARRYYDSGKRWLYRLLPFWAASLADRFLVALVPLALLTIPVLRTLPGFYRWRIRQRLYRIYGSLLELERDVRTHGPDERAGLLERLDAIEERADQLRLPVSFADQLYVLREHVQLVRRRLSAHAAEARTA
ncbi:MAG: C4-dicarboxylate ABC transporter substrate-binding protein [Deltaproteobacteria bacterium]|nr:C4-dicarboxylate ABC transporter substrate-binding protein [Deltaproteobacteria bacterium]